MMNDQEEKAIKWIKNVRDGAMVTLDHIAKNEPNVSPMLYAGRKEKAEVIIAGFEELEKYRALGTVEELKAMMDNGAFTGIELAQLAAMQMKLKEYQQLGTVGELRVARATIQAMKERNITSEIIMEYAKFEDECVQKGFTFNSLLEAREKQIPKKLDFVAGIGKCPVCGNLDIAHRYKLQKYCGECGSRLE